MEKQVLELIEAYLRGAISMETAYETDHMKGYFAAMRNVQRHLEFNKELYGLSPAKVLTSAE